MLTTALFLWTYHFLGNSNVGWRAHLPGALLVAVGFEILKVIGSVWVPRAISSASALYGAIGVVFAVLAWFAIYARLIVYGAVLNVVRYEAREGTVTVQIEVPADRRRGAAVDDARRRRRREGGGGRPVAGRLQPLSRPSWRRSPAAT